MYILTYSTLFRLKLWSRAFIFWYTWGGGYASQIFCETRFRDSISSIEWNQGLNFWRCCFQCLWRIWFLCLLCFALIGDAFYFDTAMAVNFKERFIKRGFHLYQSCIIWVKTKMIIWSHSSFGASVFSKKIDAFQFPNN